MLYPPNWQSRESMNQWLFSWFKDDVMISLCDGTYIPSSKLLWWKFTVLVLNLTQQKECQLQGLRLTSRQIPELIFLKSMAALLTCFWISSMICFNLIIHTSIPIFENGTNSAAMWKSRYQGANFCQDLETFSRKAWQTFVPWYLLFHHVFQED